MAVGPASADSSAAPSVIRPSSSFALNPVGQDDVPENIIVTSRDAVVSWCRKYSLWPMPFATACCGIELMAVGASRFDIARFGAEVMRFRAVDHYMTRR